MKKLGLTKWKKNRDKIRGVTGEEKRKGRGKEERKRKRGKQMQKW
jgi:hypothetical protein